MRATTKVFIVLALIFGLAATASAQVKIYALGSENLIDDRDVDSTTNLLVISEEFGPSTLYTIDPSTGAKTEVGPTGFRSCDGLDAHPVTNELYAVCIRLDDFDIRAAPDTRRLSRFGQVLVHIDKDTGQGTEIGLLGDGIGAKKGIFVSDIDFRQDGTLFAYLICQFCGDVGEIGAGATTHFEEDGGNQLGTIDLDTGEFFDIGPSGLNDNYSAIGFSPNQSLFQCASFFSKLTFSSLYILNQITGTSLFLDPLLLPVDSEEFRTSISSKDADIHTGLMYGFLLVDPGIIPTQFQATNNVEEVGSYLTMLNENTAVVEVIGQTSGPEEAMLAIAVMGTPTIVPTMSQYGLIATVVLLLGASALYLRRRQASTNV